MDGRRGPGNSIATSIGQGEIRWAWRPGVLGRAWRRDGGRSCAGLLTARPPDGATEEGRLPKVLIVDDSALMRRHLREILGDRGGFTVLAVRNGVEALAALDEFDPDVITLDINMPEMDGITCLSHIMTRDPRPVIMVSSLTERGAEITFAALALGAVDFIHKPDGTISLNVDRVEKEILAKVTGASRARVRRAVGRGNRIPGSREHAGAQREPRGERPGVSFAPNMDSVGVVLIGVSTGGPGTLEEILP
jgi:two-component system chemotaxis response regulator CheB